MRPEVYLRVLRRGWWVIVIAALVAGVIGYASQAGKAKTYEASTRLAVTSMPIDYFSDQLTANWTQALEPYVHNPNAVQSAADKGYLQPADASLAYNTVTRSNPYRSRARVTDWRLHMMRLRPAARSSASNSWRRSPVTTSARTTASS